MTNLLIYAGTDHLFTLDAVRRTFESDKRFSNIRSDNLIGSSVEADFSDKEDEHWKVIVRLNKRLDGISLSETSDTALSAALVLQRCHSGPLRLLDSDYSFDIELKGFSTVEELNEAITRAQHDS